MNKYTPGSLFVADKFPPDNPYYMMKATFVRWYEESPFDSDDDDWDGRRYPIMRMESGELLFGWSAQYYSFIGKKCCFCRSLL